MRFYFLLCSLFLFFGFTNALAQKEHDSSKALIPVADLQEDFELLYQAIKEGHPAWGHYFPADSMESWFVATQKKIVQPLTEKAFLDLLYPLISRLACGHTRLLISEDTETTIKRFDKKQGLRKYLPFNAVWLEGKLYVTEATSPDSALLLAGSEILQINGRSVQEIVPDLLHRFTSDGYNQSHALHTLNNNFDGYFRFFYGEQEYYRFQLVTLYKDTISLRLQATAATLKERLADTKQIQTDRLKVGQKVLQKKGYHLRLLPQDSSVAIMDIRGFRQRQGKGFYHKAFRYMTQQEVPNLVIDLRDNGGGAVRDASRLLSYLLKEPASIIAEKPRKKYSFDRNLNQKIIRKVLSPILLPFYFKKEKTEDQIRLSSTVKPKKKNHFDGAVFVLTNGGTFSASVMVGAFLRDQHRALFVGQETGGGEKGTNAFLMPQLTLPHSQIRLVFPLYAIRHLIAAPDTGRGIAPDVEVPYSLKAILKGKDLELEKVEELLKTEGKNGGH